MNAYVGFTKILCDDRFSLSEIKSSEVIKNTKLLQVFIDLLQLHYNLNSIGTSFIYKYFAFHYEYWIGLEINLSKYGGRVPLGWIIGQKAIERWFSNPYPDLTKALGVMKSFGLSQSLFDQDQSRVSVIGINVAEESVKKRFLNDERGYVLCIESTTLFNDQSSHCTVCKFKQQCQILLQQQYPKIFIARGYKPKHEINRIRRTA